MNTKRINELAQSAYLALCQLGEIEFQEFVSTECVNPDSVLDTLGEATAALLKIRRAIVRVETKNNKRGQMNIIKKMNAANQRHWDKLTDEQKERQIAESIIELSYDVKASLKSQRNVQFLLFRLDEYEAIIMAQHEALKHMIAERDAK